MNDVSRAAGEAAVSRIVLAGAIRAARRDGATVAELAASTGYGRLRVLLVLAR